MSSKFVHVIPLEAKLALPQGSQVGTWEQRSQSSKIFSETGRHRDLIFCMWHLIVDLYQVCPALGCHKLEHRNKIYLL